MLGLPQGKAGLARSDDDALGGWITHYYSRDEIVKALRLVVLILAWLQGAPALAGGGIALAADLAADADGMKRQGQVMLVLYSQANCRWCERARSEYLIPLQRNPAWGGRVVLRQIDLDSDAPLTDFAGRKTTHRAFARGERARVTPTLAIYGPAGTRRGEPIVGFRLADFYGEYIERALEEALARPGRTAR
jgi:thioredoxin-related protein